MQPGDVGRAGSLPLDVLLLYMLEQDIQRTDSPTTGQQALYSKTKTYVRTISALDSPIKPAGAPGLAQAG